MFHRAFAIKAILLCLIMVPPVAAEEIPLRRDWKKFPAIVEIDTTHDIYAIGDPHGDYERLITLLVSAKIIPTDPGPPEKVKWSAGKAVVVCTGDMIDKWSQSLRVIALFRTLQIEAEKSGGRVVVTLGNHEAEFLAHPHKKKTVEFEKELTARKLKPEVVAAGKDALGIGAWLRSLPAAARVNDWFFVHAGNTHNRTLAELRNDLQSGMDKKGFKATVLSDPDSMLEARLHPRPWWEKVDDSAATSKAKLAKCVHALGVKHLVIGHQPGKVTFAEKKTRAAGELMQHYDGLVFLIDTGMSRGIGSSNGALLHIHQRNKKTHAVRISSSGESREIWSTP